MTKVIWLTGLSGAGKSTLAKVCEQFFKDKRLPYFVLDGDEIRAFFEGDLGYSREERIANVRRVAFGAYLLSQNGVNAVVANIAPYYEVRDFIRKKLSDAYIQIYVKASVACVRERDVKGHYQKQATGQLADVIGVDDVYDVPRSPNFIVDTEAESLDVSTARLNDFLAKAIKS